MTKRRSKPKGVSTGARVDIEAYRRYRDAGKALNDKMLNAFVDRAAILSSARALGLLGKGDVLVFDNEGEINVLTDYALYEYRVRGKNAVERYQEKFGGETQIERELMAAMVASSTSLFRIESVSRAAYTIHLSDLVNGGSLLDLMDINFSRYALPGLLFFIRPIRLPSFSMTSGIAFVFRPGMEEELLRHWKHPSHRPGWGNDAARRYVTFFKLSQQMGIEVRYE